MGVKNDSAIAMLLLKYYHSSNVVGGEPGSQRLLLIFATGCLV